MYIAHYIHVHVAEGLISTCMYALTYTYTVPDIITLHTITVIPLTTVYYMSEVHCTCTLNI